MKPLPKPTNLFPLDKLIGLSHKRKLLVFSKAAVLFISLVLIIATKIDLIVNNFVCNLVSLLTVFISPFNVFSQIICYSDYL